MKRAIATATLVAVGLPGATAFAQVGLPASEVRDASAAMEGLAGTFVLLHEGRRFEHDPGRAGTRFVPASTFKIANTLIALETGVATGPDFVLEWDGIVPEDRFWPESWSRDHSLRSAFRNGVLWYYQELARRIGLARYRTWLDAFGYGNADPGEAVDRFWLDGPLAISPREQVAFLKRFRAGELGLSERTAELAREIFAIDRADGRVLSGKTGTLRTSDERYLAWFVGSVDVGDRTSHFALHVECDEWTRCDGRARRRIALSILTDWGVLPAGDAGSR